jgi:hypothetical protein
MTLQILTNTLELKKPKQSGPETILLDVPLAETSSSDPPLRINFSKSILLISFSQQREEWVDLPRANHFLLLKVLFLFVCP